MKGSRVCTSSLEQSVPYANGSGKRGRKHKSAAQEADKPEPESEVAVWVFACGCEAGSEICNSVPVYVLWDQWRGTFDLGYKEAFSKEVDCCVGADDFGVEFYVCSIFCSLRTL
jgi:hypothetical protein